MCFSEWLAHSNRQTTDSSPPSDKQVCLFHKIQAQQIQVAGPY